MALAMATPPWATPPSLRYVECSSSSSSSSSSSAGKCRGLEELVMDLERHQADRVVPAIKQWIRKGNTLTSTGIDDLVRRLRSRKRYLQALMAVDWVANERVVPFRYHEAIQRLDLCSRCHHVTRALLLFRGLPEQWKSEEAYCVLLLMYYRRGMLAEAERTMQELRVIGIKSLEPYHLMLSFYKRREMEMRFERMVTEIRGSGLALDRSFFAILLTARHSFGGGVTAVEEVLAEMESMGLALDAVGHLAVAGIYIRHGLQHKSELVLHRLEKSLESGQIKDLKSTRRKMLVMFGKLGDQAAVDRIWRAMGQSRTPNTMEDVSCGIEALGSVGKMDEAEAVYMLAARTSSNPRPHNAFLDVLVERGDVFRAEALVECMKGVRCPLTTGTYHLLIKVHLKAGNLSRAMLALERLRSDFGKQGRSRPSPETLAMMVGFFAETGDVHAAERLVGKWTEDGFPLSVGIFNSLLKVYARARVEVDGIPGRMLSAGVEPTCETELLLRQVL